MKRIVSGTMLPFLLIGILTLAFNIQPVKASGTVGVKAGDWIKYTYTISGWPSGTPYPKWLKVEFLSVEGTNATIRVTMRMSDGTEQSDTLTVDVAGEGETFQGLSGFVIPANRTIGDSIYITGYGNVTIASETTSTYAGASRTIVYASFSQYGTQLTYYWDKQTGVMVEASVVSGSVTATAKATETNMWQAETIYIRADGSIDPPDAPISTVDNVTYTLTGNITGTTDGIVVERSNIIIDGAGYTVEGTGAVYSKGMSLSRITNVTIKNTNIKHFEYGIGLYYSSNNIISGNNITANTVDGIWLGSSLGNSISGNTIANNGFGILLYDSSNYNSVSGNNITNSGYGIILEDCLNNSISGNNITKCDSGIRLSNSSNNGIFENTLTYGSDGIVLFDSSNYNVISGNKITNNSAGIWLSFSSNNNSISANSVIYNDDGVHLYRSSNNTIYHNNFINNTKQVSTVASLDFWDDGYPSGGNYWSDYVGSDEFKGSNQDEPGSDCIGDMPYIIDADNVDCYPLMNPYGAPPPPTYALTITTTVGGTTDPVLGTYSYTANSTVQVTAIPAANYLFEYWELDSANVGSANPYTVTMDKNHTLKAVFSPIPPPLSASISPLSASILAGQSVTFTSTVSGGYTPYSYQWCLNGNPVSGATSASWTFTPTTSGIYYIYLKVTDAKGNMAQSDTARITVAAVPVGGYSITIQGQATAKPLTPYLILTAILTIAFTTIKHKTTRKTKQPP